METIENADLAQSGESSALSEINYESQLKEVCNVAASMKERIDVSQVVKKCQEQVKVPKHLIIKWLNIKSQKSLFQNKRLEESMMDVSSVDQSIISEISHSIADQQDCNGNDSHIAESFVSHNKFGNKNKQIEIINAEEITSSSYSNNQDPESKKKEQLLKEQNSSSFAKIMKSNALNILPEFKNSPNEERKDNVKLNEVSKFRKVNQLEPLNREIKIHKQACRKGFSKSITPKCKSNKIANSLFKITESLAQNKFSLQTGNRQDEPKQSVYRSSTPQNSNSLRPSTRLSERNDNNKDISNQRKIICIEPTKDFISSITIQQNRGFQTNRSRIPVSDFLSRVNSDNSLNKLVLPFIHRDSVEPKSNFNQFNSQTKRGFGKNSVNFNFFDSVKTNKLEFMTIDKTTKATDRYKPVREVSLDNFDLNSSEASDRYLDMRKSFKESKNDSKFINGTISAKKIKLRPIRISSSDRVIGPSSFKRTSINH